MSESAGDSFSPYVPCKYPPPPTHVAFTASVFRRARFTVLYLDRPFPLRSPAAVLDSCTVYSTPDDLQAIWCYLRHEFAWYHAEVRVRCPAPRTRGYVPRSQVFFRVTDEGTMVRDRCDQYRGWHGQECQAGVVVVPAFCLKLIGVYPHDAFLLSHDLQEDVKSLAGAEGGGGEGLEDERTLLLSHEGPETLVPAAEPIEEKTFSSRVGDVQLHMSPSCGASEEMIGPVEIHRQVYLVHCKGHDYLVSSTIQCKPSGITFKEPLFLDFRLGSEMDTELLETELSGEPSEELNEYRRSLHEEYEVRPVPTPTGYDKTKYCSQK